MTGKEFGRWVCSRCAQPIVAVGPRLKGYTGIGAYIGPCPWDCGAWITRGFRGAQPGRVKAHRATEWDERVSA